MVATSQRLWPTIPKIDEVLKYVYCFKSSETNLNSHILPKVHQVLKMRAKTEADSLKKKRIIGKYLSEVESIKGRNFSIAAAGGFDLNVEEMDHYIWLSSLSLDEFEEQLRTVKEVYKPYVYFLQSDIGGPIKIGCSSNIPRRAEEIQMYCPFRLVPIGTMDGDLIEEQKIHKQFERSRLHGEWFTDTPKLHQFIRDNYSRYTVGQKVLAFYRIPKSLTDGCLAVVESICDDGFLNIKDNFHLWSHVHPSWTVPIPTYSIRRKSWDRQPARTNFKHKGIIIQGCNDWPCQDYKIVKDDWKVEEKKSWMDAADCSRNINDVIALGDYNMCSHQDYDSED